VQGVTLLDEGTAEVIHILEVFRNACLGVLLSILFGALLTLTALSDESGNKFAVQSVMRNLGAHLTALEIMQSPSDKHDAELMTVAAMRFLAAVRLAGVFVISRVLIEKQFMTRNRENQNLMFRHRQLMLDYAVRGQSEAVCALTELVRDNRTICHQLSDAFIGHLIEMAAGTAPRPDILRFLQVCTCSTVLLPENPEHGPPADDCDCGRATAGAQPRAGLQAVAAPAQNLAPDS
jgi:hypothetical protein